MGFIAEQTSCRVAEADVDIFEYDRKEGGPKESHRSPLDVADSEVYLRDLAKAPDVSDADLAAYQECARGLYHIYRPSRRRQSLADPTKVVILRAMTELGKCLRGYE